MFRHFGLAARFVSGYLIQLKPDVKSLDGPSGAEKDFTDLHAWTEVYLPGAAGLALIRLPVCWRAKATFRSPARPIRPAPRPFPAAWTNANASSAIDMTVKRVYESPRVTKPYTEEQWSEIEKLGHAIDVDLKKGDVRLTMGGEPTFVSMDDPDGPEWNFTAVSHKKSDSLRRTHQAAARKICARLAAALRPGQMVSGRTAAALGARRYWRKDGVPIWKDDSLIADESKNYGHGAKDAKELLTRIAQRIGADPKHLLPAYEDAFYYTWKERRLPSNVTPEKSNLKDKLERDRIARIFQQGLGAVVGYALPIKRASYGQQPGWMSGSWFLRDDDTLWLIPGDSPMGLRLPLDSVPWVAEKDFPWLWQQDPSQPEFAGTAERISVSRSAKSSASACAAPPRAAATGRASARKNLASPKKAYRNFETGRRSEPPSGTGRKRAVDHPHRTLR